MESNSRRGGPGAFGRGGSIQGNDKDISRGGHAFRSGRGRRGRGAGFGGNRPPAPRPTHFLAIPLGTHSILRRRISEFTDALLNATPPIGGLENRIVVDPRRVHFTLGVMALQDDARFTQEDNSGRKTVEDALELLKSLKPRILDILNPDRVLGGTKGTGRAHPRPLHVPLKTMDVLKPERNGGANVLWVGPDINVLQTSIAAESRNASNIDDDVEDVRKLVQVSELVHQAFKVAGFIVDSRPLKLHCTLVNTSYRRVRGIPFAYDAILSSKAVKSIRMPLSQLSSSTLPATSASLPSAFPRPLTNVHQSSFEPVPIDFGTWAAKEIQLCIMGSYGPENEYVSAGGIRLDSFGDA